MNDCDDLRRLIDEIEDMIENIDEDFPLLDFNSRYMTEELDKSYDKWFDWLKKEATNDL